jgi:hypothetical protein
LDKASKTASKNTPATIQAMPCNGRSARKGTSVGEFMGSKEWWEVKEAVKARHFQCSKRQSVQFTASHPDRQSPELPTLIWRVVVSPIGNLRPVSMHMRWLTHCSYRF